MRGCATGLQELHHTEDGKAKTTFTSDVKPKNPRSVIGYYEPGHYCFVQVDGRKTAAVSVLKDALLAVRIPAGEHEIEFTYDPVCVKAGWALTCAGLCVFALGTLFYPFVPMNRKRKKTDD